MIIRGGKVFLSEGGFHEGDVYIENGKITEQAEGEVIDASGLYVIPGLTDIHFHACMGVDFSDGEESSLQIMADYELSQGVTQVCPASMTLPEETLNKAFTAAKNHSNETGSVLVGINMEGPFLSYAKKGAQNPAYIHRADADMFHRLQTAAGGLIKLCDIAPEMDGALECIEQIKDDTAVSIAHSAADYETAEKAIQAGARHITHLYNGMTGYTHRQPGIIGAACDHDHVMVELICDGIHVHPSAVRTTFKMFGDDRICIISDSLAATGLGDGQYMLGGQEIFVNGKRATLADGTLAGSVSSLMGCMRTVVKEMGIPLASAVKCAAVNPAKAIGIYDRYGSLDIGKEANIVLLDEDLNIVKIIYKGRVAA